MAAAGAVSCSSSRRATTTSILDTTFRRPWSMYDRCFGVAASTLANDGVTEIKAGYSNFGTTVDWCAPSNDNEGLHNPPGVFGAHSATIEDAPEGDAIRGHPAQQTTLAAAAAAGAMSLTLASAAGFAVGQAVLAGAPGGGAASGRRMTAVNAGANQITLNTGFGDALPVGAPCGRRPPFLSDQLRWHVLRHPRLGGHGRADAVGQPATSLGRGARPHPHDRDQDRSGQHQRGGPLARRQRPDLHRSGLSGPNFSEFFGFGRFNAAAAVQAAGWRLALMIADAGNFGTVSSVPSKTNR